MSTGSSRRVSRAPASPPSVHPSPGKRSDAPEPQTRACDEPSDAFASALQSAEQIRAKEEAWETHVRRVDVERANDEISQKQEVHAAVAEAVESRFAPEHGGALHSDEWNGFDDAFWGLGQLILWMVTFKAKAVDQASSDCGRLGDNWGPTAAATVIELLEIPREELQLAFADLRRRCLRGDLTAYDHQNRPVPKIDWRHLEITLDFANIPSVQRIGQSSIIPVYNDLAFLRADVLREFKPELATSDVPAPTDPPESRDNAANRGSTGKALHDCKKWLSQRAKSHPKRHPEGTKPNVLTVAQKMFPGLSEREFDRIWGNTIAEHPDVMWHKVKRSGPRIVSNK